MLPSVINVAFFSTKPYDRRFFDLLSTSHNHRVTYFEPRLTAATACLARGYPVVCAFVNDQLDAPVLEQLHRGGTRLLALRSAGHDNVDLVAAQQLGLTVVHVPHYSPHAVAEHTIALILGLNRQIPRAHNRVREGNFSLDGLLGFDLNGKTAGLIGGGRIGARVAHILHAFGCRVLVHDPQLATEAFADNSISTSLDDLLADADIVSLHCPLTPESHHLINGASIARMKRGVMLINTSRGALIDTAAAIEGLLTGQIGYLGLDVYEGETELFYEDHSNLLLADGLFARLLTMPNVLITGHQAFFTVEALSTIARTTIESISSFAAGRSCAFELTPPLVAHTPTP